MKTLPAFYLDFSQLFDLNFYAPKEQRREGGGGEGQRKEKRPRSERAIKNGNKGKSRI